MIRKEKYEDYKDRLRKVVSVNYLTASLFVLQIERNGMVFRPGQFIILGFPGDIIKREYSLYGGVSDEYLEVLIREVPDGDLSTRLKQLKPGDEIVVDGPAGDFVLSENYENENLLFMASGTGVSPFRSFIRSHPQLNFSLYHGIRSSEDNPLMKGFESGQYVSCMSAEDSGDYHGYVTHYLKETPVSKFDAVYLCGNGNMVYDAFNILMSRGLDKDKIHTEIFF